MKKFTRTTTKTLAMLIATAAPMALTSSAIAGPEHNHAADAKAPSMDAKAKKIWDRANLATLGENAEQREVKTVRMVGTMSMPAQGITADMNILLVAEKGMTLSFEIPGLGAFNQGVLGDVVWSNDIMSGPRILDEDEAMVLLDQMDLYANLNWEEHYESITYKGQETVTMPDDTEIKADVLDLTSIKDQTVTTNYYASDTGLLIRTDTLTAMAGSKIPSTSYTSDYRELEGMMFPFKTVASVGPNQQLIEFSEITVNGEVDESELELPEDIKELLED